MDTPVDVPGFVLEQELGAGGHGSVWLAREESSGELVALKLLMLETPEQYARAHQEAAALVAVDHPHLVPFYGAVEIDGGLALVTAFAGGGSLADVLSERGMLLPGEVVTICAPIAEALGEVHRRGLVHGDIKPTDIVFTAEGRPMLADLGISRLAGVLPGFTPGFTAPEVEAGHWPSPESDVYGLAVLAVVGLTGYLPSTPFALPGIAPATHGALAGALLPDPARRPDADTFANAVFALADPEPVGLAPRTGEFPVVDDVDGAADEDGAPTRSRRAARSDKSDRGGRGRKSRRTEEDREPPPAEPVVRRRTRTPRKRDIIAVLAIIVTIPVVALGVRAVWNQATGNPDASLLPGAGRVTAPADAEGEEDLCGGPQPAPTEAPPDVADWTPVVERLMELRAAAFNNLDPEILCQLFEPTSPYLASDYELLRAYREAGVRPAGLRFEVVDVELVSQAGESPVILEITDRAPAHQLVNEEGEVVSELDGVPEATWRAELVVSSDASGWRFS